MAKLELFLLGRPQICVDGQAIMNFNTRKDQALLAYLAVTGAAHSRETLAGLLWSELPEDKARRNLRHALSHLQKTIGPPWLTMERGVALTQDQIWSVDVHTLRSTINNLTVSPSLERRNDTQVIDALDLVLHLYRGEFLQGFHLHHAAPFEEWVLAQREELRLLTLRGLEALVERCLAQGAYEQGLAATRRLLQLEPWSEPAHCLQMQLLAHSGRRAEAVAQYARCRTILAAELGVAPLSATTALYQQIQTGRYNGLVVPSQPELSVDSVREPPTANAIVMVKSTIPNNLITPLAAFVGRQAELALIRRRLGTADCRLLTIAGPGGMGKTSLAHAVGQRMLHTEHAVFPDGIYFVALAGLEPEKNSDKNEERDNDQAGSLLTTSIAERIGCDLQSGLPPQLQLQNYLRHRRLLLILDNFEHLLSTTDTILSLLTQAPALTMLITSRARLNVRGETVLVLAKLSLQTATYVTPADSAQPNSSPVSVDEGRQASEAVAMFVQRAQCVDSQFTLNAANLGSVTQICQLVDGLPLGIELATSMLPLLNCTALAAALTRSLDFLAAETHDLPSEQRTLGAVFERSWRLLPPEGQQLLAKLAIFPGSFSRSAAERIASASISLLRRLLDQSLLNKVGDERYAMHRTVHAFAQQKLQQWPEQSATLPDQYAHFYLAFLARLEQEQTEDVYATVTGAIQTDLDNVRTAWRWSVGPGQPGLAGTRCGESARILPAGRHLPRSDSAFGGSAAYGPPRGCACPRVHPSPAATGALVMLHGSVLSPLSPVGPGKNCVK